jgi:hypothetical protein
MTGSLKNSETITDLGTKTYVFMCFAKTKNPSLDAEVKEIITGIEEFEEKIGILDGSR